MYPPPLYPRTHKHKPKVGTDRIGQPEGAAETVASRPRTAAAGGLRSAETYANCADYAAKGA